MLVAGRFVDSTPWPCRALSAYFGLSGLFVTSSGGGTGLRGFVGVSSLIPVNVELGLTVLQIPGRAPQPSFFVRVGSAGSATRGCCCVGGLHAERFARIVASPR